MSQRARRLLTALSVAVGSLAVAAGPSSEVSAVAQCDRARDMVIERAGRTRTTLRPATASTFNCRLGQGATDNWGVIALQITLRDCYGQGTVVDGYFGPQTRDALLNAQRWEAGQGFPVAIDGHFGPQDQDWLLFPTYYDGSYAGCLSNSREV